MGQTHMGERGDRKRKRRTDCKRIVCVTKYAYYDV